MSLSFSSSSLLLLLLSNLVMVAVGSGPFANLKFGRDDFPTDFVFGAGTSAYQVEGAVAEDGRSPSIWDIYTHQGKMQDKSTADIAADAYHKYKEDIKIMSDLGLEAYRFSISWSRLLPHGTGAINQNGLEYYNNLINILIDHGIEPHITIYHLDLPQVLEDRYGGWLNPKIVGDFRAYADVCFREFGDRVSHWTTLNEPNINDLGSYNSGQFPPQRCTPPGLYNCTKGNSSVEPYIAMHHILLAHASAVTLYKEKYQAKQKGLIGLNIYAFWCTPMTNSSADARAAQRAMDFFTGWVVEPLMFGDYPNTMRRNVGARLPSFTKHEYKLVKGSFDFIGLNHYFTFYVKDAPHSRHGDFDSDMGVETSMTNEETPPGPFVPSFKTYNPSGMKNLLEYFKDNYGNPPIYIQENGFGTPYNETLNDTGRIHYVSGFMESLLDAVREGSNTKGYFIWSFLDSFEVLTGYRKRYGIVHVDFDDKNLKRRPKLSAQWYSNFIKSSATMKKNTWKNRILSRIAQFFTVTRLFFLSCYMRVEGMLL